MFAIVSPSYKYFGARYEYVIAGGIAVSHISSTAFHVLILLLSLVSLYVSPLTGFAGGLLSSPYTVSILTELLTPGSKII
jgi:hypothetical protein